MTHVPKILVLVLTAVLSACGGERNIAPTPIEGPVPVNEDDNMGAIPPDTAGRGDESNPTPTPMDIPDGGNVMGTYIPNRPNNEDTFGVAELSMLFEESIYTPSTTAGGTGPQDVYIVLGAASGTVPNSQWTTLGTGTYAGVTVGALTFEDSENADRVVEYLKYSDFGSGISTFNAPVTVRLTKGATAAMRHNVKTIVDELNQVLPEDRRLTIGSDVDRLSDPKYPYDLDSGCSRACPLLVADNELVVAHVDSLLQEEGYYGRAFYDRNSDGSRRAAYLSIDNGDNTGSSRGFTNLISHEMLHALGLDAHVPPSIFPDALLSQGGENVTTEGVSERLISGPNWTYGVFCDGVKCTPYFPTIPAIEGEAIWALYNRFATTGHVRADEISIDSLGYWEDSAYRLFGLVETTGGRVGFGVDYRRPSGWVRPWFAGISNFAWLGGFGTAVWNGAVLGVTPALDPVVGKTRLSVDMDTQTGNLEFDNMKTDNGSGAVVWGNGELSYTIGVHVDGLYKTGGADGDLRGVFLGPNHEGVGGTLRRDDLVAAFGASRQAQ